MNSWKISFAVLLLSASAHAGNDPRFVVREINIHNNRIGTSEVSYPRLNHRAGAGYQAMNRAIRSVALSRRCDANREVLAEQKSFVAKIEVQDITPNFVSIIERGYVYCGGAHPETYANHLVFNAQTGAPVNLSVEFGGITEEETKHWTKEVSAKYEAYKREISALIAVLAPNEARDCFKEAIPDETLAEQVAQADIGIGIKAGKIVFTIEPAHVMAVCGFELEVPYVAGKSYIREGSFLHNWLR